MSNELSIEDQLRNALAACKAKDKALQHVWDQFNGGADYFDDGLVKSALALQPDSSVKPEQE